MLSSGIARSHGDTVLPPGFTEKEVVAPEDIAYPTAMAFAPDGRLFVCEQAGFVRIVKHGVLLAQPFLAVNAQFYQERGLVGLTLDPNFPDNQYVYVYYTTPLPVPHNRVSRFTAGGDLAVPGSELVLLDLPALGDAGLHNSGGLNFGPDRKLYVSVGDNLRSTNSASLATPLGKILRVNADGSIPNDNPFYNVTTGINRTIWAMGLRNPFTFTFQRTTGRMFINDVGNGLWEEINEGMAGANFGWPRWEGASPLTDRTYTSPLYTYPHPATQPTSSSITGGAFYNPATNQFPAQYLGKYFFMDGTRQWIRVLDPVTLQVTEFAPTMNSTLGTMPLYLIVGPEGSLYYVAHFSQAIYKIEYDGQIAPQIGIQPTAQTVAVGDPVTLAVAAYGAAPVLFQWQRKNPGVADFADVPGAATADFTIPAVRLTDDQAQFRARISNGAGTTNSQSVVLAVTTAPPPVPVIVEPAGATYRAGDTITLVGSATAGGGGALPASAFLWSVEFHHQDHMHPFIPEIRGVTATNFVIPTVGESSDQVSYRILLTVTDPNGLERTVSKELLPVKANFTLQTDPPGLLVGLDGAPLPTPATVTGVAGVLRALSATPQVINGTTYEFAAWSDGGAATHTIATPGADATYTAQFRPVSNPVDDAEFLTQYFPSFMAAGQSYEVNLTLRNSGTTAWSPEGNCFLASVNPDHNLTWGLNRVALPGPVLPGDFATFRFNVTAPAGAGVYNMQWRMLREGSGFFGTPAESVPVTVAVVPSAAAFVAQAVPAVVNIGQRYSVSVSFKNVGTNIWSETDRFRLSSYNPRDNKNWGVTRALLPGAVAPGEVATFEFNIQAPDSPGLYNFQWRMVQDGFKSAGVFGDLSPNLAIEVRNGGNGAAFLSQSVPATMQPGQSYPVVVALRNTGTTTWTPDAKHRLASVNPVDNGVWGTARAVLLGPVAPGEIATFNFVALAPATPGTFNFQWRMVQENVSYFGELSPTVSVAVGTGTDDAAFVSQLIPSAMEAGRSYPVTITMRNSGTLTWPAGGIYTLGSQNPAGNLNWGLNRVSLPTAVDPGQTVTLNFNVQAPVVTGPLTMQWQMLKDGVGYFGQTTAPASVNVFAPFDDAQFVAQDVPATMNAGASYSVSVTLRNSGTTTWRTSNVDTETIALGYKPLPTSTLWGLNRVVLPGPVAPGATVTFNFTVQAPAVVGTQDFQWQVVKGPVGFFGQPPPNVAVQVNPGTAVDDAAFVSQLVPPTTEVGRSYPATVVLRNAGTTTWLAGAYRLGSQSPADNLNWGANRVALASNVAPGQNATFTFNLQAPPTPGAYVFQWRMGQSGSGFFGQTTPGFPIPVTAAMNVAAFVSQAVPTTMVGGRDYAVTVILRNTGATVWDPAAGYQLVALNPAENSGWGLSRVVLDAPVNPGSAATFNFTVTAPVNAGTYNFQWGMVVGAAGYFSAPAPAVAVTVAAVDYAAEFVGQTVPAAMGAGGVYPVSLTFKNTGTNTWTAENLYRLGSQNPDDTLNFGANRVLLPGPVAPGQTVTFSFNARAATTPGTYNFQWRLLREGVTWIGDPSPNVVVNVLNAAAPDAATFVSQSVPATMTAGQPYRVAVTFNNSGSATWSREMLYRLGSQNPQDNRNWNVTRVLLPDAVTPPGGNATFTFTVLAPQVPGSYHSRWRMVHEGAGWFGDASADVAVNVVSGATPVNGATFVSQTVPSTLVAGQAGAATVVLRNSGSTTWSPATNHRLAAQNPGNTTTWGTSRIELAGPVAPGETVTLNFPITAPAAAGNYNFQWQMTQDGVGGFGDVTPNVVVPVTPAAVGFNGSAFVAHDVPLTLTAGQTRAISVTLRNSGTTTWSTAGNYQLASQNAPNNLNWSLNRVTLPASVPPGGTVTFSFSITAPATVGTFNLQWQMVQNGVGLFGDATPNTPVSVTAPAVNAAVFVSQSVPAAMIAGQNYPLSVTLRNSGTTIWTAGASYRLASQNPADNTTWSFNRVALPNAVTPGTSVTFNFTVPAPAGAGTYNSQWRMVQDGVGAFGDSTPNVPVSVTLPATVNAAAFVTQSVPTSMTAGQSYAVTVTLRNSGTTTWSAGASYRLASVNPADNTTWSLNRVALPNSVAPGASVTFSFSARAPATAGSYNFQWRMIQDGVGLFGDASANTVVAVTTVTPPNANNAQFVSQTSAVTVKKASFFLVAIKMKNTGTATWLASGAYKLGSQNPADNTNWGLTRALLGTLTPPGGTATFTFLARAPATAGTYNLQWQMLQEGIGFFGEKTANLAIAVNN